MKKTLILIMIVALLILSACADNDENTSINGTNESNKSIVDETTGTNTRTNQQPINIMPDEFEEAKIETLGLFTFILEDTIDDVQAQEMLVLWQVGKSLIESSTAADAELDAITKQISGLFTEEQIEYLMSINLEEINMMEVMGDYGSSGRGGQGNFDDMSEEEIETLRASNQGDFGSVGGTRPSGGQGGGLGGGLGGQEITPEMEATREAMREEMGGAGFGMNTSIFDSVIQLLEEILQ